VFLKSKKNYIYQALLHLLNDLCHKKTFYGDSTDSTKKKIFHGKMLVSWDISELTQAKR